MNRFFRVRRSLVVSLSSGLLLAGCHGAVTDALLRANDPDLINPSDVTNADAANGLRLGALSRLRDVGAGSESSWLFGGLLADEWSTASTFIQNDEADERKLTTSNGSVTNQFRTLGRARTAANQSIAALRTYSPTLVTNIGELYFARGFAEMQMASDFCSGIPLTDGSGAVPIYSAPKTTAETFTAAIASLDSAIALLTATDTGTVTILNAAKIAKARALMGLGGNTNYQSASTLVASIPLTHAYNTTFATTSGDNILWNQPNSSARYTVGDSLEGNARNLFVANAIPFFSAQDPRLPVAYTVSGTGGKDTLKAQDGFTYVRKTTLWARTTPVPLTNGIDAKLIVAEALLSAGNSQAWLDTLNSLRTQRPKVGEITPAAGSLSALAMPATAAARVNLMFREKAFWTFSRGQRLGDLRRLIRQYGRTPDTTFPVGTHYRNVTYGDDVNLPVPKDEEKNNPLFNGCLDRKA